MSGAPRLVVLPPSTVSRLRSDTIVPSLAQAAEELVANALDAGATAIAVSLHVQRLALSVADNGSGLRQYDLQLACQRHCTSKLSSLTELEDGPATLGFRGEALASLADVSILELQSRARGEFETYYKLVKARSC